MKRPLRPFDDKPAAECLKCGTPIGHGEFCLQCLPPSAREGESAWVRHRWFSGRHIELRKRRMAFQERLQQAAAVAAASVLLAAAFYSVPKSRANWSAFESKPVHAQKQMAAAHAGEIAVKMT